MITERKPSVVATQEWAVQQCVCAACGCVRACGCVQACVCAGMCVWACVCAYGHGAQQSPSLVTLSVCLAKSPTGGLATQTGPT